MAFKKVRNMKVYKQSGYNYKAKELVSLQSILQPGMPLLLLMFPCLSSI